MKRKKTAKKYFKLMIASAFLSVPFSVNALATNETEIENINGGYEIISDSDDLQLFAGITSGKKDGGYWIRGKRDGNVVSEYKHYTYKGRASVVNGKGKVDDGGWKPKNKYSKAKEKWTIKGTNKAYYDWKK